MRRSLLTASLVAALAGGPAQAAPSPQLTDPLGDWAVASQDFTAGRLSSVLVSGRPQLRGELRLAAAPAATAPTKYSFWFGTGCVQYGFTYDWTGAADRSEAALVKTTYCDDDDSLAQLGPDATWPVTFTVNGTTLTWQVAYVGGIAKGMKVDSFTGQACATAVCGVMAGTNWDEYHAVWTSDVGWSQARYVVGSDLPRR